MWPLNVGQVYTTLQRLERDGLVASDGADDGPAEGLRDHRRRPRRAARLAADAARRGQPPRDELLIKVLVAVQVPGVDVHEVIQVHRRHLVELMQRYTAVKADAAADDVALALVVDAELFRIEAAVRWLDSAEVRLRQQPPRPAAGAAAERTVDRAARRRRRGAASA